MGALILPARRRSSNTAPASGTLTYVDTPDAFDVIVHPSIVDMGSTWNGYRWWRADTPYPPGSEIEDENPCIFGSNDRINWVEPAEGLNPIAPAPVGGFNSDTELVWDPETSRLICFWRHYVAGFMWLRTATSTNGTDWTITPIENTATMGTPWLSPTITRVSPTEWRMWRFGGDVQPAPGMYTATNPLATTWTKVGNCVWSGANAGVREWHGDIIRHKGRWIGIFSTPNVVYPMASTDDGLSWVIGDALPFEAYRPTMIPSTVPGFLDVWTSEAYYRVHEDTFLGLASPSLYTLGTGKSLDLAGTVNLVVDGNSIYTDLISTAGRSFDETLRLTEPLASAVDTSTSVAISGQTWSNMVGARGDVAAAWVEGATNILVLGETRNQIVVDYGTFGITDQATLVANCKGYIQSYLAGVRATHPDWKIIICGTLPSGGQDIARYQVENAAFEEVDAWLHANVDTLGLHAVVNYRNHAPFNHDGTLPGPFQAYPTMWTETAARWTHPADPGLALMAQNVNAAVEALKS